MGAKNMLYQSGAPRLVVANYIPLFANCMNGTPKHTSLFDSSHVSGL